MIKIKSKITIPNNINLLFSSQILDIIYKSIREEETQILTDEKLNLISKLRIEFRIEEISINSTTPLQSSLWVELYVDDSYYESYHMDSFTKNIKELLKGGKQI